jgi:peptidylprolyl isomerase
LLATVSTSWRTTSVPTNKQRRESARRHLERQLQRRQEREARRRQVTLISSIAGTLVLIAVIVIAIVAVNSGGSGKKKSIAGGNTSSPAVSSSPMSSPTPTPSKSYAPAKGAAVTFKGVTVKGAADLKGYPVVTSKSSVDAKKLAVKDLVVGKGKAATPTSTVTVQYSGVLYKNGKPFDSSWSRGQPAQFPLTGVVKGFTQGIGGTTGVPPMKVGGRRIMILPSSLGYGAQGSGAIPANSSLVFVVDLVSVGS